MSPRLFGVVIKGRVALRTLVPERGMVTILTVEPGDIFGWSASCRRTAATRPRWRSSRSRRSRSRGRPCEPRSEKTRALAPGPLSADPRGRRATPHAPPASSSWTSSPPRKCVVVMPVYAFAPGRRPAIAGPWFLARAGPPGPLRPPPRGRPDGHRPDRPRRRHRLRRDPVGGGSAARLGRRTVRRAATGWTSAADEPRLRLHRRAHVLEALTFPPDPLITTAHGHGQFGFDRSRSRRRRRSWPSWACGPARSRRSAIQDRVFLGGQFSDADYARPARGGLHRRGPVHHARRAPASAPRWAPGPRSASGYDILLTEIDDGFVVAGGLACRARRSSSACRSGRPTHAESTARPRTGRARCAPRSATLSRSPASHDRLKPSSTTRAGPQVAERCLDVRQLHAGLPHLLLHVRRSQTSDLDGDDRRRPSGSWDSLLQPRLRPGRRRRLPGPAPRPLPPVADPQVLDLVGPVRHSGCVGCGRCITWCPVGIDVREELAAIAPAVPLDRPSRAAVEPVAATPGRLRRPPAVASARRRRPRTPTTLTLHRHRPGVPGRPARASS